MTYALTLLLISAALFVAGFFQVKKFVTTTELGGYMGFVTVMSIYFLLSGLLVILLDFVLRSIVF